LRNFERSECLLSRVKSLVLEHGGPRFFRSTENSSSSGIASESRRSDSSSKMTPMLCCRGDTIFHRRKKYTKYLG
jgi:hypothetical protein